jgi:hypothetical protein
MSRSERASPDSDSVPASSTENAQALPPAGQSGVDQLIHPGILSRRGASGQRISRSSANFSRPSTRSSSSLSAVSVPGCAV